jgi:poly-gamma-glutamate synthesis protein (capsule biosynthesis protein)
MTFKLKVVLLSVFVFGVAIGTFSSLVISKPVKRNLVEESISTVSVLKKKEEEIKLIFLGDMMFDRQIRVSAERNGYDYLFQDVSKLLDSADLVVGNLEGSITTNESLSVGTEIGLKENYIFTFSPDVAQTLHDSNVRLVNLGNNHILNFGKQGLRDTIYYLEQNDVGYFGSVGGDLLEQSSKIVELGKVKIGFVNYNQYTDNGIDLAVADVIRIRKNVDILIVYAHWGTEYVKIAGDDVQHLAHTFIDYGADLIVGSHPHVIQRSEVYKGKKIYYSLGNFVFDQYFSEDTKEGLLVEVIIDYVTQELNFVERRVSLKENGQTLLLE